MDLKCFVLCLVFSFALVVGYTPGPKVNCPAGMYEGTVIKMLNGKQYFAFRGIRYATAPRFKLPQRIMKPIGLQDATKDGSPCPQFRNKTIIGKENCLFLNVYTPSITGKRPVLVFIHGGSFIFGSIEMDQRSPDYFMEAGEIVLVVIQYRLGALGFIDLSNKKYPSNLGLFDQRLALTWVKKNVKSFGGDPNQITLMGNSAGSASVHVHLLQADKLPGLFSRCIMQSGSIFAPWGLRTKGETRASLNQFLTAANCLTRSPDENARCLLKLSFQDILRATKKIQLLEWLSPFGPVLGEPPILEHPMTLPPVSLPFIAGVNSNELDAAEVGETRLLFTIPFINTLLPRGLMYDKSASNPKLVTERIKSHYKWKDGLDPTKFFSMVASDSHFVYPNYEIHKHSKGPSWSYHFDIIIYRHECPECKGTKHADEMKYLFPSKELDIRIVGIKSERLVSRSMVKLWIHFVKTGNPSIKSLEWPEYKPSGGKVLMIKNEGVYLATDPAKSGIAFWNGLPFRDKVIKLPK